MAVDIIARGMAATADSNAEIARKISAPDYDPTETYNKNDIVFYDGKLYICTGTNVTGVFDPAKWSQIIISDELTAVINRLAQIDNPMLIKGVVATVGDLPANAEPGWVYFVGQTGDTDYDEYVYTEDDGWQHIGSAKIIVDSELSLTSANPVENRVITAALNTKLKSIAAAAEYDPSHTYIAGEYMTLNGELYKYDANGSYVPIGENLLVTYAVRMKDSTYGYQNNKYLESYGTASVSAHDNMYISGTIPLKQNTRYKIYEAGWPVNEVRYYAVAILTDANMANFYERALTYGDNGASATGTFSTGSYQYISLSMPKDDTLASQYYLYELTSQTFTKTTIIAELAGKADTFTTDPTPTASSTNPVQSGGVKTALDGKVSATDYATASTAGIVKPDGVTITADENGVISATTTTIDSWYGVRDIVRRGLASRFFQVGDLLVSERDGSQITWQIIGIDQDTPVDTQYTHSLTLCTVDCINELQFDSKEAMFAFDEGLVAGTYHFTVGAQPWVAGDVGKTVQFTLTSDIPAGGQIVFGNAYNATMVGATVSVYASPTATTASETATLSEGTDGTGLGTLSNATNGAMNSVQRGFLGSNNYNESAIRQYLNSDKAAGSVWATQTKWDRPPSWAASTAGLLYRMDPEFVSVIGKVKKRTAKNTVSDGGGYIDTEEKIFLLSKTEVYAGANNNVDEGGPYRYFSEFSDLSSAGTGADSNRTKYRNNVAKYWWLRSPFVSYAGYPFYASPSGTVNNYGNYATNVSGVAPACCIV